MMSGGALDIEELKNHFTNSLEYLANRGKIYEISERLYSNLQSQFSSLKSQKDNNNWSLSISPNWEISLLDKEDGFVKDESDQHKAFALIGGIVRVGGGRLLEYTFTLCLILRGDSEDTQIAGDCNVPSCCLRNYRDRERIVRRFHFDIDTKNRSDRPTSHLQYGGGFAEDSFDRTLHYCLDHKIKKPRLPYPPMDFVLIFDLLMEQYDNLKSLREENWGFLVKESEKILLHEYYAKIHTHFSTNKKTFFKFLSDLDEF